MAARTTKRGVDLRALTRMIADANDDQPGPMLPWSLMDDLTRLIPAEEVSICDLDLANRERELQQDVLEDDPRFVDQGEPCPGALDLFWRYYTTHWTGFLPSKAGQVRPIQGGAGASLERPVPGPNAAAEPPVSGVFPTDGSAVLPVGRAGGARRA